MATFSPTKDAPGIQGNVGYSRFKAASVYAAYAPVSNRLAGRPKKIIGVKAISQYLSAAEASDLLKKINGPDQSNAASTYINSPSIVPDQNPSAINATFDPSLSHDVTLQTPYGEIPQSIMERRQREEKEANEIIEGKKDGRSQKDQNRMDAQLAVTELTAGLSSEAAFDVRSQAMAMIANGETVTFADIQNLVSAEEQQTLQTNFDRFDRDCSSDGRYSGAYDGIKDYMSNYGDGLWDYTPGDDNVVAWGSNYQTDAFNPYGPTDSWGNVVDPGTGQIIDPSTGRPMFDANGNALMSNGATVPTFGETVAKDVKDVFSVALMATAVGKLEHVIAPNSAQSKVDPFGPPLQFVTKTETDANGQLHQVVQPSLSTSAALLDTLKTNAEVTSAAKGTSNSADKKDASPATPDTPKNENPAGKGSAGTPMAQAAPKVMPHPAAPTNIQI